MKKGNLFLVFILALVLLRLFISSPFDSETKPNPETYYSESELRLETGLNHLGNIVFYFPLEVDDCFNPMDEVSLYQRLVQVYPEVALAVVFHDPGGSFSNSYPDIGFVLKDRFQYFGSYFFDRDESVLTHHHIVNEPRIFIFNNLGNLLNILSPADALSQKERVRYYFEVARLHL